MSSRRLSRRDLRRPVSVSGITIGYQALANGYPVLESIRSMLPACDEIVANIGKSSDGTPEAVRGIGSPKVKLLEEPWDLSLREKGLLLSRETNRAMDYCTGDWIVYLQADEVLHEKDLPVLRETIEKVDSDRGVDGISFRYLHFYGSPWFYQDHPFKWYRRAVRSVRNDPAVRSVGDALKFRRLPGAAGARLETPPGLRHRRVRVVRSAVTVYHYGWARPPEVMLRKQRHLDRFWHRDEDIDRRYAGMAAAEIYSDLGNLERFTGSHPAVMADYVGASAWPFESGAERQPPRWLRLLGLLLGYPLGRLLAKLRRVRP